ncbi:HTH-type transcriptional regulator GalR [Labeo rohita]|uniref:HTH-type transcriptional regulator GalR n=1 Tax=Labeo rohita TaxID=84645 RepID=A0ABQ8L537_LABRO|nr:HTH-type transcriptional regulator GalR [Labeo rohita]
MEQCVRTKKRKIAAKVAEHFHVVSEQINQQALDFDYGEPLEDVFEDSVEDVLQNTENECATDIFYDALDFKSFNDFENDYADTDLDCSDSEDEIENASEIQLDDADGLAEWAAEYSISQNALSALLKIKQKGLNVPLDARTLMCTERKCNVKNVAGGSYYHFGIRNSVVAELASLDFDLRDLTDSLTLRINIDGLPLFRSTTLSLWPILTEADSGGNLGKGKRKKRAVILSSSDEDSDGAGHDRPPFSVPLLPPVPEICQPEAPQVLNIRPFVQPRPPSAPPAVSPDHRLQHRTNNSAFRDGMFTHLLSLWRKLRRRRGFMERRYSHSLHSEMETLGRSATPGYPFPPKNCVRC